MVILSSDKKKFFFFRRKWNITVRIRKKRQNKQKLMKEFFLSYFFRLSFSVLIFFWLLQLCDKITTVICLTNCTAANVVVVVRRSAVSWLVVGCHLSSSRSSSSETLNILCGKKEVKTKIK